MDALHEKISEQYRANSKLAIARYVRDGGDVLPKAQQWIDQTIQDSIDAPDDVFEARLKEARQHTDTLAETVKADGVRLPDDISTYLLYARHAVSAAEQGNFSSANGMLYDFLVDAGAVTEQFDVF